MQMKQDINDAVVDWINDDIKKSYISINRIAQEIGIPYATFWRSLNKERDVSFNTFFSYCKFRNIKPSDAMKEIEKKVLTDAQ